LTPRLRGRPWVIEFTLASELSTNVDRNCEPVLYAAASSSFEISKVCQCQQSFKQLTVA
jgi:hypothetical protein